MVCINSCVIGFALVGGMIMTMLSTNKSKVFLEFENLLDNKQKKIYHNMSFINTIIQMSTIMF